MQTPQWPRPKVVRVRAFHEANMRRCKGHTGGGRHACVEHALSANTDRSHAHTASASLDRLADTCALQHTGRSCANSNTLILARQVYREKDCTMHTQSVHACAPFARSLQNRAFITIRGVLHNQRSNKHAIGIHQAHSATLATAARQARQRQSARASRACRDAVAGAAHTRPPNAAACIVFHLSSSADGATMCRGINNDPTSTCCRTDACVANTK